MKRSRTMGYLRSATSDDDFEKTKESILKLANDKELGEVEWVEEIVSGLAPWKERKIAQVLEDLQPGDSLVVRDISRLSRSPRQFIEVLSSASQKNIKVFAVDQPWLLDGSIPSHLLP